MAGDIDKSYRVTVKVRNANLLRAIEQAGHAVGGKFAELVGIKYTDLNDLANMKTRPIDRNGDLKPAVEKLCIYLNKMPSELFDFDQMHNALDQNSAEFEADSNAISALCGRVSSLDTQLAVDSAISTLTEREQKVIRLRFGIDCEETTLRDIGNALGITQERVRQIEIKAMRKLRLPSRSDALKQLEREA